MQVYYDYVYPNEVEHVIFYTQQDNVLAEFERWMPLYFPRNPNEAHNCIDMIGSLYGGMQNPDGTGKGFSFGSETGEEVISNTLRTISLLISSLSF